MSAPRKAATRRDVDTSSSVTVAKEQRSKKWKRRSEARPGEIVAAATTLFCEHGFAATRLEDVAERAGVTKTTVYLYFENKERLLEAVVLEAATPNIERAEALIANYDGSSAALLRMLVTLFEGVLGSSYTAIAKTVIAESGNFPNLAKLYADNIIKRGVDMMETVIRRGVERGEFRPVDPSAVAPLVMAPFMLLGVWKHSFAMHSDLQMPAGDVLREHAEILIRGLAPEPTVLPTNAPYKSNP